MPINVTCPGCEYHFLVGDEFAGRPGRCPECETVIHVPDIDGGSHPVESSPEPDAFANPHPVDSFEEFPRSSRRRDDERERHLLDLRQDEDDRPRLPTFDPHARAAKWQNVSNGLRNLMVAVVILAINEIVGSAFTLVDGIQPGQGNNLNAKEIALVLGNAIVSCIALALWAMGRIGCGRVPYVPARRIARPAGVIAGMTAAGGILGLAGMVGGVMIMQQNQGAGLGLMCLGACTFLPAILGFVVAEFMGLLSQIKIATGLRDHAFATASKALLAVVLILTGCAMIGGFALVVFMGEESNKAQQRQFRQQQAQQPKVRDKNRPPLPAGKAKGNWNGRKNGPAVPANPPAGQQQPPPFDIADYPGLAYGILIGRLAATLIYAFVAILCVQLGRAAIRREIANLIGDPHDQGQGHGDAYK